ncbi:MAG: hypothetical protein IT380_19895 [Myxococcales bacterium]|nr:hypothetical protein [Myxococcales bacterium]
MHTLLALVVAAAPASPGPLPLKTLVLYENGVGYFERRGSVPAGKVAEIPLESGQLDDALKSLVVMSEAGVASVEFAPPLAEAAARALAGLPEAEGDESLEGLLLSLQGVDVEVSRAGGAAVRGRVLQVSDEAGLLDKDGKPVAEPTLLLFGAAGLAKVPLRLVQTIRPVGEDVAQAWSRAAGSSALQPERERLVVRGSAKGGAVAVGYTTEAPVWRTTYRLVLGKKARLQGFALVHNDSDEAWNGVAVTLASGRPTSFLFPLAGPRYGRREFVTPEDGLENAPQLATREAREHLRGQVGVGVGMLGSGSGGGGYGSALGSAGYGHVGVMGRGAGLSTGISSTVLEDGPTPLEPAAVSEAGDLFLYSVKEPVVLGARKSALLPIIDGPTGAERVTLLDAAGEVFSGVRLANTTALTLEGGTLSVFTDGAYAGETQIDRVKPGEVRVLKHGVDLDLQVTRSTERREGDLRKVRLVHSAGQSLLELTRVDRLVHTVSFTSRTDKARTVLVELPEQGYRVVKGGEEDVRSPGQPRYARLAVAAKASEAVEVVEEGAVVERLAPESLSSARVAELLRKKMPDDGRALLASLKARLEQHEAATARAQAIDAKIRDVESTIARTRDNLAATGKGGAARAAEQLGQRLLALEGQLDELKRERASAGAAVDTLKKNLTLAAR